MAYLGKSLLIIITLFTLSGFFLEPSYTFAQSTMASEVDNGLASEQAASPGSANQNAAFTSYRQYIYATLSSLGAFIAKIGGGLLDYSISWFAVDMAKTSYEWGVTAAIHTIWSVIRDLFNLLFIFGLIYAGFKIILGIDDSGSKRSIGYIVVAALLINFSLFISQIVVDVSNVATHQIHKELSSGMSTSTASRFVEIADLDKLYARNADMAREAGLQIDTFQGAVLIGFVMLVFYSVLGFVFAAGAFLLFTRFVTLILIMMFSPIMFLGWLLPKLQQRTSDWWRQLFNQSLIAPAYVFMLYLALKVLENFEVKENTGLVEMFVYILFVTAMAWAALLVTKQVGAVGAASAVSLGKRMAGGASAGLAARGLQNTVGRGFQRIADSDVAKKWASRSLVGKSVMNFSRRVGDANFDARNVGGVGKKLGVGEGIKTGYKSKTEAIIKREKEFADSLGQVSDDDPRVKAAQLEVDATDQAIKKKKKDIQDERKRLANLPDSMSKEEKEEARREGRVRIESWRAEQEELEEKHTGQKENLQNEKHRYQIGARTSVPSSVIAADKAVGKVEKEIENLKKEHSVTSDKTKRDEISRKIGAKKEELAAEQRARRMKYRKSNVPERIAVDIADLKKEIKDDLIKYQKLETPAEKEAAGKLLMDKREALKKKESEANKLAGGYATTVANKFAPGSKLWTAFQGRNVKQNEDAADAIYKEYKKKAKAKDD